MPSRPTIALALSGGAARGLAHVGVLRALVENKIPVDYIAGTSAGSIVGGAFVRERLPKSRFEDLPIPLAIVATDLKTGGAVVMRDEGDVPFAIRASCAIPGWYVPVVDKEGRQLVDGGLVAVVPVSVARSMGADIVIAIDVNFEGATFLGSSSTSVVGVVLQSMLVVQKTASHYQLKSADFVISPKVGHIRWDEMGRAAELIAAGYDAGRGSIPALEALIERTTAEQPKWYQLRRKKKPLKEPLELRG
jgi:NTE family protein